MSDQSTDVPGASIRRIRGEDYVVVTVGRMFPGTPPPILGLAARLHLQPDVVLHALLGYRANAAGVRGLYRQVIDEAVPRDLAEARRLLYLAATRFVADDRFPFGTETPYVAWAVIPDADAPIVLPLSQGFREIMREATTRRQREMRLQTITPALDELRAELTSIRNKARDLSELIRILNNLTQSHAAEVLILDALDGLLGTLLVSPKDPPVDSDDRRDAEQLRRQLEALRTEAYRDMILEPDAFWPDWVRDRNREAVELRGMIEASAFVDHVRTLASNVEVIPSNVLTDITDTLRFAFQVLLVSPESDAVLDNHVIPMITTLAGRPIDTTGLSAPRHPDFERAVREAPVAVSTNSVLQILAGPSGLVPSVIGNYPGPNTLAVSIMELAAPLLVARVVGRVQEAGVLAGRLYRALVSVASVYGGPFGRPLSLNQRVILIQAIDEGNLSKLRQVNWSSRFMNSPAWGSAIAIASAICFAAAIERDDANTLRHWADITSSASGTALGVSVALARWSGLVRDGIVRGVGGRALGVIGGIAAVISGAVTAREEYRTGDNVGMWMSIAAATGGALSVAGFLVAAGLGSSATVAGAPLGVVLMAAGVVIGVGAGIVSPVRSLTTAGSEEVFEAYLNHFGRDLGPFQTAAQARPSLQQAFEAVQTGHHGVDFWDAHPSKIPQLFDLGFGFEDPNLAIVKIVDEDEPVVRSSLLAAGRIPEAQVVR